MFSGFGSQYQKSSPNSNPLGRFGQFVKVLRPSGLGCKTIFMSHRFTYLLIARRTTSAKDTFSRLAAAVTAPVKIGVGGFALTLIEAAVLGADM